MAWKRGLRDCSGDHLAEARPDVRGEPFAGDLLAQRWDRDQPAERVLPGQHRGPFVVAENRHVEMHHWYQAPVVHFTLEGRTPAGE